MALDEHGAIGAVEVVESGGAPFDEAAQAAVRHWIFKPALREGVPVASHVRVPFRFLLASHAEPPAEPPKEAGAVEADPHIGVQPTQEAQEAEGGAGQRGPSSGTSRA